LESIVNDERKNLHMIFLFDLFFEKKNENMMKKATLD